jgi:hypothetical protein
VSERITKLKTAIRETNGCDSRHVKSVPVTEIFRGKIVWDGIVEVSDLIDHPKAKRAFAWSYREGKEEKSTVVLGIPTVIRRTQPLSWLSRPKLTAIDCLDEVIELLG